MEQFSETHLDALRNVLTDVFRRQGSHTICRFIASALHAAHRLDLILEKKKLDMYDNLNKLNPDSRH